MGFFVIFAFGMLFSHAKDKRIHFFNLSMGKISPVDKFSAN